MMREGWGFVTFPPSCILSRRSQITTYAALTVKKEAHQSHSSSFLQLRFEFFPHISKIRVTSSSTQRFHTHTYTVAGRGKFDVEHTDIKKEIQQDKALQGLTLR